MRLARRLLAPLQLGLAVLAVSASARAADAPAEPVATPATKPVEPPAKKNELRWDDRWPRFRPAEFILTGEVGPASIAEYWLAHPQPTPRWTQTNPFDSSIRNALRLRNPGALRASWTAASAVDVTLVALTVGIDSLAVPFSRGNNDVAVQLGLIDMESFAVSSAVVITAYDTVGRARPSYADCQANPSFSVDCRVSPTASFPSGHVNQAFTSAGLSCSQHLMLPLYGNRTLDVLACARDLALASADGVLRIMGDRHYATDVLMGSALGFTWGYVLPMVLHYGRSDGSPSPTWTFAPLAGGSVGIAVVGKL
jgi:hypothetical protein